MPSPASATARTRRDAQAEETRRTLVATARQLFARDGYAATGTEALVVAAGVGTRGALYHHFADKEALFAAVLDDVLADLGVAVFARVTADPDDPLATLAATVSAFLDCLGDDAEAQAIFRDGPAALGWEAFRAAELRDAAAPLQALLDRAAASGHLIAVPTRPLARLLVAALDEAALAIISAPDQVAARADWGRTLDGVLAGLAAPPSGHP